MATAVLIDDLDLSRLSWLEVLANDGKVYRFVRTNIEAGDAQPHIQARFEVTGPLKLEIAMGSDGQPLLSQKESGLQAKIVVEYIGPTAEGRTAPTWFQGKRYFEQE